MTEKEFSKRLREARSIRLAHITRSVKNNVPKEEAGLLDEFEEMFYDKQAEESRTLENLYSEWPCSAVNNRKEPHQWRKS